MAPEDRIDPKHQAQACQWIEDLMGIKINNKHPPNLAPLMNIKRKILSIHGNPEGMTMTLRFIHVYLINI